MPYLFILSLLIKSKAHSFNGPLNQDPIGIENPDLGLSIRELGAYLFNPNEITYVLSISIIAILNMIIHTQELKHVKWIKYFVSPNQHNEHHRLKNRNILVKRDDLMGDGQTLPPWGKMAGIDALLENLNPFWLSQSRLE